MRGRLVLVVVATLAAGCGGTETSAPRATGGTTTAPEPTTTKATTSTAADATAKSDAEFVSVAEAICSRMQRDAEVGNANARPSEEQIAKLVDGWRSAVKRLAALEPPRERKRQFQKMLAEYRLLIRAIEAMTEAEDESVLAAAAGIAVFGQRGSRAAREAGLDACALFPEIKQPLPDPQDLYEATRDLVPAQARILRDAALDCVALDSCRIEYELDRSLDARLRQGRALLRAHGWKNIRSGRMPTGGRWMMANRNDYAVTLEFGGEELPEHCGGRVTYGCSDGVWVHRVEVPEVLTGG